MRERGELLELLGQRAEIVPHRGDEQLHRLRGDRQSHPAGMVHRPATDPVGTQAVHLHRRGTRGKLGVGIAITLDEDQHGAGIGVVEVSQQLLASLGLLLQELDAPQHDRATFGEHRGGVDQHAECLRVQITRGAGVHIEVAGGRVHRALEQRPYGLLLQDILLAMEIVHRDGCGPLLQTFEERVEGEGRHTWRKLPPGHGG